MTTAIRIESVSKLYRLGTVGTGTLAHDLNRWWHVIRGKEDPYAKVGQVNDRTQSSTNDQGQKTKDGAAPDYVWALRDINLEVQQGEILGIIGRNGAGKSTLLKLLSRVTAPTTGSIKTKGRIASLLEVGTGFHPELTGRENIYINGAILGMKRHEITRRLDEIVEFSGCAKYVDTPVKRYSSGMMVRLGFAVAAHLDCEILIVDEVLAVGDFSFQEKCMSKMRGLSQEGHRTIVFVSHNMEAISALCTTAVVMQNGHMLPKCDVSQAVEAYFEQPRSPSTRVKPWQKVVFDEEPHLSLKEVVALGNQGESAVFDVSETIRFRLQYEIHHPPTGIEFSLQIRSALGQPIFTCTTADTGMGNWEFGSDIQVITVEAQVPGFTLNCGNYEVHFAPFMPGGRLVELVSDFRVSVVDKSTSWVSAPFRGPRQGMVLSRLQWNVHLQPLIDENNGTGSENAK